MARTILEIYDAIIAEKELNTQLTSLQPATDSSQKLLTDLTSTSKVAIWRLIFFVVAVAIWIHEKLFDEHILEIEALKETLVTGTDLWYSEQSKLFQLGDSLTWDGSQFNYTSINADVQIVAFSSAITESGILQIKVAKDDGTGKPTVLSGTELTAFTGYVDQIIFAGTQRSVISLSADLLKFYGNIIFDPLVLASDGSDLNDGAVFPVEGAIDNYLFNLDFNGIFRITDLIDAMQTVNGVLSVIPTTTEAKADGGVYIDVLNSTRQEYIARAGYMNIDVSFPLSTTLTFLPR